MMAYICYIYTTAEFHIYGGIDGRAKAGSTLAVFHPQWH